MQFVLSFTVRRNEARAPARARYGAATFLRAGGAEGQRRARARTVCSPPYSLREAQNIAAGARQWARAAGRHGKHGAAASAHSATRAADSGPSSRCPQALARDPPPPSPPPGRVAVSARAGLERVCSSKFEGAMSGSPVKDEAAAEAPASPTKSPSPKKSPKKSPKVKKAVKKSGKKPAKKAAKKSTKKAAKKSTKKKPAKKAAKKKSTKKAAKKK